MIFTHLRGVTAYRMHQPVWAARPTSGAGAGRHGGRANRPGVDALYLALDEPTAIAEYRQLSGLLPPGTLVAYTLSVATVVDFTGGYTNLGRPCGRNSMVIGASSGSMNGSNRRVGYWAMR